SVCANAKPANARATVITNIAFLMCLKASSKISSHLLLGSHYLQLRSPSILAVRLLTAAAAKTCSLLHLGFRRGLWSWFLWSAGIRRTLTFQLRRFFVGDVPENLQASRQLFGHDDAVILVDGHARRQSELSRQRAARAEIREQMTFLVENLHASLPRVHHPDVPVRIHRDSLGPRECT